MSQATGQLHLLRHSQYHAQLDSKAVRLLQYEQLQHLMHVSTMLLRT
jgi:hypothetical protein